MELSKVELVEGLMSAILRRGPVSSFQLMLKRKINFDVKG